MSLFPQEPLGVFKRMTNKVKLSMNLEDIVVQKRRLYSILCSFYIQNLIQLWFWLYVQSSSTFDYIFVVIMGVRFGKQLLRVFRILSFYTKI